MTGDDHTQLIAINRALGRVDPDDLTIFRPNARDLALLDNIHAHVTARPRIPPSNRIMTRRAAPRLPQPTQNWITWAINIHDRAQFFNTGRVDPFGLHTLQRIGMGCALIAAYLVVGLRQHNHTAWAEHDVVIQIL